MRRFSASIATAGFTFLLAAVFPTQFIGQEAASPSLNSVSQAPSSADAVSTTSVSKVRIVRVSEVRGTVQLDRSNGHGYEAAITNLPVVENNQLKTGEGVAEVEFEDNSTLRLGPNSEVQFVQLGRTAQGSTLSTVRLVKGIAYVSLLKASGKVANANEFTLSFGDRKVPLQPGTHVRLEIDGQQAQLAVLGGKLQVNGPDGVLEVPRKKTATFALTDADAPEIAKNDKSNPLDAWDKQNTQYHERVAYNNFGSVPYSYGLSDMLYYGSFMDMGGCGMMWRPYFASAAWDPYSAGTWAYYAGAGYSWVSPYPWGWTPYHYGAWSFCPGAGWGWMPGGTWYGLNNIVYNSTARTPTGIVAKGGPRRPTLPHPPRSGSASMVFHNTQALVHSGMVNPRGDQPGAFVFRKDSAGMGVPRNELGNLRGFSHHAMQKGVAVTPIYATAGGGASGPSNGFRGPGGNRGASSPVAPVMIHRGFAPEEPSFGNVNNIGRPTSTHTPMQGGTPTFSAPVSRPSMPTSVARPSAPSGGGGAHPH